MTHCARLWLTTRPQGTSTLRMTPPGLESSWVPAWKTYEILLVDMIAPAVSLTVSGLVVQYFDSAYWFCALGNMGCEILIEI